jgi:4-hydroxy-tetrahydrodipicolinate synthase
MTPTFFKVNDREMEAYYMEVSKSLPDAFPIYMYNIPQLSANDLIPDTIKEVLSSCKNIRGIKYSYPDILRIQEYLGIGDGFSVLAGADAMALAALCLGCDGIVSGVASVYPEPYVEIYRAYSRGEMVKAREFQRMANRYSHALKNGSNTGYFKAALNYRGIDVGHVRKPNLDITEFEKKELLKKLETLDAEFQKMINRDK